jgi:predicted nuclease of predicted toxin-antitoxin system
VRLSERRFLADQNVDEVVVARLKRDGLAIVSAAQLKLDRAPDIAVLQAAASDGRTLLTHDIGFGDMVVRERREHSGILLLRPGHAEPEVMMSLLAAVLEADVAEDGLWIVSANVGPEGPTYRIRSTRT